MANSNGMNFVVHRTDPVMVYPAKETPKELLYLSNLDDVPTNQFNAQALYVYAASPPNSDSSAAAVTEDPALVIRDALSKALVYYYPLAGRFRKSHNGKLEVDCNGEGAAFVQGTANCTLEDMDYLSFPTAFSKKLYYLFPETYEYHDIPPLTVQVTRFVGGGYVVALGTSHCLCDGAGISQFIKAIGELARGMPAPSVIPVWERHLLAPRNPPQVNSIHSDLAITPSGSPLKSPPLIAVCFFMTADAVTELKHKVLEEAKGSMKYCTRFEALASFLWKWRVKALGFSPDHQVQLLFCVNARTIYKPPLPEGYYGNGIAFPYINLSAKELSDMSVPDLVKMIREKKDSLSQTDEYMRSVIDLIQVHREDLQLQKKLEEISCPSNAKLYLTDVTRLQLTEGDFGSGGGVFLSFELHHRPADGVLYNPPLVNDKWKDGVIFRTCLPAEAVATFKSEMDKVLKSTMFDVRACKCCLV